ncbi:MAG: heparinase II/III family protein, partial [Deltaproteobacteria bacterium]|nr:heparinase II/III family protein [Deltaproteobacteria bacterium]
VQQDSGSDWQATVMPEQLDLSANGSAEVTVTLLLPEQFILPERFLETDSARFVIKLAGLERDALGLEATVPLPHRSSPRLFLDQVDFVRILAWATSYAWADSLVQGILARADSWPASHNLKYGLASWSTPPEGGQWGMWYVCPDHGVYLSYQGPGQNVCPIDDQNFSGWPYDQVIYSRRHSDSARAAKDLGLAYQLTGDVSYASAAAEILLAYADIYLSYPIHDINGGQGTSGARARAQTLDESVWLIPMAWAYDLIADSAALDAGQHSHIKDDLLQAAVAVIQRNDAGISNWQSWHNAAIGAVGFAVLDPRLQSQAISGSSGFEFQMAQSVTSEGLWYEGSWGYHFYALDALTQTALMAELAGLDLFSIPALHAMYTLPVKFSMPDLTLPPINDSSRTSLISSRRLFEIALARYSESELAAPLTAAARREEALFFGVEQLPPADQLVLDSMVLEDAGFVVMRAGPQDMIHYLVLDYGPHGGWHGHFDKLGFVSFARGAMLAVDPGTQSYAVDSHTTWDKVSVAHNTVVIDETTQAEASGTLQRAILLPGIGFARADAGPVYPQTAQLVRTIALLPEYAIDLFEVASLDAAAHQVDLVYHNFGTATTDQQLSAYSGFGASDGYQHLTSCQSCDLDDGFEVRFDLNDESGQVYGSVWASPAGVLGTFTITRDQAFSGSGSGELHYDFSGSQGYILYSTEQVVQVDEVPDALRMQIFGDASNHELTLRIMDATDERFTTTLGPIDWSGWQTVRVADIADWSHYLGNDDGLVDTPVSKVVIQLNSAAAGPLTGEIFVDDIVLEYPLAADVLVENFDRPYQALTWQVLGETGTTLVVGQGLGPDLTEPVPFAMARRMATNTEFISILEPHGVGRTVESFSRVVVTAADSDEASAFLIASADWNDFLMLVGAGAGGVGRTAVGWSSDGTLTYVRKNSAGDLEIVGLATASELSGPLRNLLTSSEQLDEIRIDYFGAVLQVVGNLGNATVRIYAPVATSVDLNGAPVDYQRDGDYVVINETVVVDGGDATDTGDAADAGLDGSDPADSGLTDSEPDGGVAADEINGNVGGGCGCATPLTGFAGGWLLLLLVFLLTAARLWTKRFN